MVANDASPPRMFSSNRERRLWLWTLAAVVGIYSTLGVARTLAEVLRARDLLNSSFVLGLFLIGAAIVALAFRSKPGGMEIGVMLGIAAVYLMLFLRMAVPEARSHLAEYSVVAVLVYEALRERADHRPVVAAPWLLAVGMTAMVGTLDELIQAVLPFRVFDPIDIAFYIAAAVLAVTARVALGWARGRRRYRVP